MTPGHDPLTNLQRLLTSLETDTQVGLGERHQPPSNSPLWEGDSPPPILIIDQFEELFTLTPPDQRDLLISNLVRLIQRKTGDNLDNSIADEAESVFIPGDIELPPNLKIILTMRADFWGECATYTVLKDLMQSHQELVGPMTTAELRGAMEQQARKVGLRFEADLSYTILDAVKDEPGAMPLLQHALLELWKRRHGRWLRAEEYRAIGGVQKAIAQTAEEIYQQATPEEQNQIREIFIRLTRSGEKTDSEDEHRDTRQRISFDELVPAGREASVTRNLVERLASARLLVTGVNNANEQTVEVAHEALIRHWPLLQQWLNENRDMLRLRESLREAAQEWEANRETLRETWGQKVMKWVKFWKDEQTGFIVHRGERLAEVENSVAEGNLQLNEQEQSYLATCIEVRGAARRRNIITIAMLLSSTVILIILAIFALSNQQQALIEAEKATTAEADAKTQRDSADTAKVTAQAGATNVALAQKTTEAERNNAEIQRGVAETQKSLAEQSAATAEASEAVAQSERDIAEQLRLEAEAQSQAALARQLSAQALADTSLPQRNLLLSLEAINTTKLTGDSHLPETEQALRRLLSQNRGHFLVNTDPVYDLAFSYDGRLAASIGRGNRIVLWDMQDMDAPPQVLNEAVENPAEYELATLAFNPTRNVLASGHDNGSVLLWGANNQSQLTPIALSAHQSGVKTLLFRPDGRWLLSISDYPIPQVLLHDTANSSNAPLAVPNYEDVPSRAVFDETGQRLLLQIIETAYIWDISPLDKDLTFSPPLSFTSRSAAFIPNTSLLALTTGDNEVTLINLDDPEEPPQILPGSEQAFAGIDNLTASPDGRWLVSTTGYDMDPSAQVWDLSQPAQAPLYLMHPLNVGYANFSQDSQWLISISGQDIYFRHVSALQATPGIVPTGDFVRKLVFGTAGLIGAITGSDLESYIWLGDLNLPQHALTITMPPSGTGSMAMPQNTPISVNPASVSPRFYEPNIIQNDPYFSRSFVQNHSFRFSPDGRLMAFNGGGAAHIWDTSRQPLQKFAPIEDIIGPNTTMAQAFSDDGRWFAAALYEQGVAIWDLRLNPTEAISLNVQNVTHLTFSGNGQHLIVNTENISNNQNEIFLWEADQLDRNNPSPRLSWAFTQTIHSLAINPTGSLLAITSDSQSLIFDLEAEAEWTALLGYNSFGESIQFSPDGQWLVVSGFEGPQLWAVDELNQPPLTLESAYGIYNLTFSSDGRWLAGTTSAEADHGAVLWDLQQPTTPHRYLGSHSQIVDALAFSPDNQILATGGQDNVVRLWQLNKLDETPLVIKGLEGNILGGGAINGIMRLAFRPDGAWLVGYGFDGPIYIWQRDINALSKLACGIVGRNLSLAEWKQTLGNQPYRQTCPQYPIPPNLQQEAEALAQAGDIVGAIAYYEQLQKLDSTFTLNPQREAERVFNERVTQLLDEAAELGRSGQVEAAEAKFAQALVLNPELDFDPAAEARRLNQNMPENLIGDGARLAREGDIASGLKKYEEALTLDSSYQIPAPAWHIICQAGAQTQQVSELVLATCDSAIALEPDNGLYYNSRGWVRLLLGNVEGASRDFAIFEAWSTQQ